MIIFQVSDMTCGHCAGVITKAVRDTDPAARRVMIESAQADAGRLAAAIREEGYTPELIG